MQDTHREFKDRLYSQFARLGKALANPHRLEMLELLAQGERTVDSLTTELGVSVANASQHLQALRQAALVDSRKEGLFVHYRLADPEVLELTSVIRSVAERRLADLERLVHEHFRGRYCIYADRAVEMLRGSGRRARRLADGFPEWRAAGRPVSQGTEPGALRRSRAPRAGAPSERLAPHGAPRRWGSIGSGAISGTRWAH
jgi:DNA-binding transcriptional ArsR family regulator